jgi:hypothetical protein
MRFEDKRRLATLYASQALPVDRLPYTVEFDKIAEAFNEKRPESARLDNNSIWLALVTMRKGGDLVNKGR